MTILGLESSDAPALIDAASGRPTSFRDLLRAAEDLLDPLTAVRSTLFIVARNDAFTVTAYVGALTAGHPVALLDGARPIEVTAEVIEAYRPPWVAGPPGTAEGLRAAGVPLDTAVDRDGGELIHLAYGDIVVPHQELALLLSTSGTTGSRKLVRLSRRNLESNARSIAQVLELGPDERPISTLPLPYTFGLSVLHSHWLVGAPLVLTADSIVQGSFWEAFEANGCTSLAAVPFTFQMLERVGFRDRALPTLRTVQQAGGALDRRTTELYATAMRERGARLVVMYGQTEATARMAWLPPDRLPEKLGSAGQVIPGGMLSIDPTSDTTPDGRPIGEVLYEGPNVMLGYATSAEDLALPDQLGGTLRTGDLGYLDDDGFLFLVGRSKRIAKVFGLRVNLDEVEILLREQGPAVAVAGDERIRAYCAFGTEDSLRELSDRVTRRLRIHRSALEIRRIDAIPLTAAGKVDYQEVSAWTRS